MTRTVSLIDTAIGTLKAARDHLRHDPHVLASDLSAVIGTTRELAWTIDTLTAVLVDAYTRQSCLGHDGHDDHLDPAVVVARIVERLAQTRRSLDTIDSCLSDAHNHAAKLHNLDR
jgi:hypothetical protein